MKSALALLACSALALLACSSTPAPRFHSLLSAVPASAPSASEPASTIDATASVPNGASPTPLVIELSSVSIPAAVDQVQWVVRMPDDSLRILEQEQWIGPLREELRAAIAARLAQRFGAVDSRHATPEIAARAWRVSIDVRRFESIAGRETWLDSTWTASGNDRQQAAWACLSRLREPAGGDLADLAAAHRRAVVRLADQIGQTLLAAQAGLKGAAPRCP